MRYAIGIEYDGSPFRGWQAQDNGPSVQAAVAQAVSRVADHEVSVVAAGRTDTGVHAQCQVAHFDSHSDRSPRQWVLGCNTHLPESVAVLWAVPVSEDFHARFSAVERHYRYTILNRNVRPALMATLYAWHRRPLDETRMAEAAAVLVGSHDFSAFRSAGCQARHAVREVTRLDICREQDRVLIDISANAFLYHMVRNIAGLLIEVGNGERPTDDVAKVLASRDRSNAGVMAPPQGLCLVGIRYPRHFDLPQHHGRTRR